MEEKQFRKKQTNKNNNVETACFYSELFWASSEIYDVWRLELSKGFSFTHVSEHRCWLLVAISAGPVGPTPTCSFSWLLGLPHSMNGWVPNRGGAEGGGSKRNRQKLFAFYYLVLESHNVTFTVCKPTRFKKKHILYLFMVGKVGLSNSHVKTAWRIRIIIAVVFGKYLLPHPPT